MINRDSLWTLSADEFSRAFELYCLRGEICPTAFAGRPVGCSEKEQKKLVFCCNLILSKVLEVLVIPAKGPVWISQIIAVAVKTQCSIPYSDEESSHSKCLQRVVTVMIHNRLYTARPPEAGNPHKPLILFIQSSILVHDSPLVWSLPSQNCPSASTPIPTWPLLCDRYGHAKGNPPLILSSRRCVFGYIVE